MKKRNSYGWLHTLAIVFAAYLSASPLVFHKGKRELASIPVISPLAISNLAMQDFGNSRNSLLSPHPWRVLNARISLLDNRIDGREASLAKSFLYNDDTIDSPFFNLRTSLVGTSLLEEMQLAVLEYQRDQQILEAKFQAIQDQNSMFTTKGDLKPLGYSFTSDKGTPAWGEKDNLVNTGPRATNRVRIEGNRAAAATPVNTVKVGK